MKKHQQIIWIILLAILVGGFLVRLYRIDNPIADWHSWRQADTSAVSRNFVNLGFDIFHPRYDDLSNVASGKDNPNGYRMVEFPIYNIAQAGLFQLFGFLTLEEWGRIVSIISSTLSSLFLFLIISRHSNKSLGILAAFFYTFIPYDIYYGRTILPDTSMVMATLGGIYFFDKWIEAKKQKSKEKSVLKKYLLLFVSLSFTSAALLLKPYALFFVLPMIVLLYNAFGLGLFKRFELYIFAIVSVLPLVLWRLWEAKFPEGIASYTWLFNGNGIRFHPSFFRWILYERLTKLISGYLGMIIVLYGVVKLFKLKEWLFFLSFLISSLVYISVIATGNVQHDYYQILIMPCVAIIFAIGSYYLYSGKPIGKVVLAVSVIGLFWFGWYQVKDYFNINHPSIIIAGDTANQILPKDAKVIAYVEGEQGDTSLLYRTKRKGWPTLEKSFSEMTQMGANYFIVADPTPSDLGLSKEYKIVKQSQQFVIFDLRNRL